MKKLVLSVLSGALLLTAVACGGAKTTENAPNTTGGTGGTLDAQQGQANRKDAASDVRQNQIASDKRAIDDRNAVAGSPGNLADNDLQSLVRNRLETALPGSQFLVEAKDGAVTVSGKAKDADSLKKVESTVKEVKGVKSVVVKATAP